MNFDNTNNTWANDGRPVTPKDVQNYEDELVKQGLDKYVEAEGQKDFSQTKAVQKDKHEWIRPVQLEIDHLLALEDSKGKGVTKKEWYEQIAKCDTYKLAEYAICRTLDAAFNGWSKRKLFEELGRSVGVSVFEATMNYNAKARRRLERLDLQVAKIEGFSGPGRAQRTIEFADKHGFQNEKWMNDVVYLAKHGAPLALSVLRAIRNVVEYKLEKRGNDTHTRYYVALTEEASATIGKHDNLMREFSSYYGPMICAPRKWHKDNLGPYMTKGKALQVPLVRNMGEAQRADVQEGITNGDLNQVMRAVNAIQETAYRVNPYVYEALVWVNSHMKGAGKLYANEIGQQIGGFPNTKRIKWSKADRMPEEEFAKLDPKTKRLLGKQDADRNRHNLSAKGSRELIDRTIKQAEKVMVYDKFWLPHNLDYRGRVYHVPDFGHHKTDFVRALFEFANRTEVTEDNEWLIKLQLANHAGQDKQSLKARVAWADANEQAILAAGEDFKTSYDFWGAQDDDSFQFLAACRDWYCYKQAKSNGERYFSGLPISFDATQSGVQHMCAATKSKEEGEKVNLLPPINEDADPEDFYKICLKRAIKLIEEDKAEKEVKVAKNPLSPEQEAQIEAHEQLMAGIGLDELLEAPDRLFSKTNPDDPKGKKLKVPFAELGEREQDDERDKERKRLNDKFKKTAAYKKREDIRDVQAAKVALKLYENPIEHNGVSVAAYGRKQMKRNAMTFCYSSEAYGFADQLMEDWMDKMTMAVFEGKLEEHPFGEDDGFHAARYLAKIHYEAIQKEIPIGEKGMKFFKKIARNLAKDVGANSGVAKHFHFINQLFFPMHQNYREHERRKHKLLGMDTISMEYNPDAESSYTFYKKTVHVDRSANGIAPNLIHQQDSIHLMMTVLECLNHGVEDFMMIHDSFATTIGHAQTLAYCLRKMFIELYDDYNFFEDVLQQAREQHSDPDNLQLKPIIKDLKAELEKIDPADEKAVKAQKDVIKHHENLLVEWPKLPEQGNLDVNDVQNSTYFFS